MSKKKYAKLGLCAKIVCVCVFFLVRISVALKEKIRALDNDPPKTRGLHANPSPHTHDIQQTALKARHTYRVAINMFQTIRYVGFMLHRLG